MVAEVTPGLGVSLQKHAIPSGVSMRQGRESVVGSGPSSKEWRGKGETVEAKAGHSGVGLHSFSTEEREYLCGYLNNILKRDNYLSVFLPLDQNSNKMFEVVSDGIFLWCGSSSAMSRELDNR